MKQKIIAAFSWGASLWAAYVFLWSLPYKFTGHPDTQHIFGTIGEWMRGVLGDGTGTLFSRFGAYGVGTAELIVSVILLIPAIGWVLHKFGMFDRPPDRALFHGIGGLLAAMVMSGAVFFHLFTPLGIEVLHDGKSDGGSLFYAAVSILVLGLIMAFINLSGRQR